jgi:hypothetical protein
MNTKHTKGPWTYTPNTMYVLGKPDGVPNPVAAPYGRDAEQCQANAALIAAAPKLLEALQQIERLSREADGKAVDVPAMLGDIARAAVAKAEG